ncbi:class I SAM-dependent methyltransferase [Desulfobacterales bacterium HSG2]|nr:class I SAM-dependent methyltransferase [Desulfobacterales bacterium HSG2]
MKLLRDKELEKSSVAANCLMNRERKAFGDNSYQKEIHINPVTFLKNRAEKEDKVRWLDICCGRGRALIQVAEDFRKKHAGQKFSFTGIDLAGHFDPVPKEITNLKLIESSLANFDTEFSFDLITCVHGMHYVGDKLDAITKYVKYLKTDGLFLCNIDTNDMFDKKGKRLGRKINSILRNQGLSYDSRKKLLKCRGRNEIFLPFKYVGANDRYGKNYTGQNTVSSLYKDLRGF